MKFSLSVDIGDPLSFRPVFFVFNGANRLENINQLKNHDNY